MIASEYGYTFNDVRNMTLREIQIALRCIAKRKKAHNRFEAVLHGLKIADDIEIEKEEAPEVSRLTTDQEKMIQENLRIFALQKRAEAVNSGRG